MPYRGTIEQKRAQRARYRRKNGAYTAPNYHQPWRVMDLERVMTHIIPDVQLSKEIGRSVHAIAVQRNKQRIGGPQTCTK